MEAGAGQVREGRLERAQAIVQRQQGMPPEGDGDRLVVRAERAGAGIFRPSWASAAAAAGRSAPTARRSVQSVASSPMGAHPARVNPFARDALVAVRSTNEACWAMARGPQPTTAPWPRHCRLAQKHLWCVANDIPSPDGARLGEALRRQQRNRSAGRLQAVYTAGDDFLYVQVEFIGFDETCNELLCEALIPQTWPPMTA